MSTRELLIQEIAYAPEDILQHLLRYLHAELKWQHPINQNLTNPPLRPMTTGAYADYWNQFIGVFADEPWERPSQDLLEEREEW